MIGPFLRDPGGWLTRTEHHLTGLAVHYALPVMAALAVAGATIATMRRMVSRWRHRRLARDARIITLLPPPAADLAGAEAFWSQIPGLLRPAWHRHLTGQPHLTFEYVIDHTGIHIQMWIPGQVPPGLIERAIQAAWPGTHTTTQPATAQPPLPEAISGGILRLARPDHYPLRFRHDIDPIRGLLGATTGLNEGEHLTVQVLTRPVTGRRLRRALQAAAQLRGGATPSLKSHLFDLITPGTGTRPGTAITAARPEVGGEVRTIVDKASQPRLETLIRYGAATTNIGEAATAWRRGRAHAVAASFAVFTGANHLIRRRLRHPQRVLAERRMRHGDLLSVAELAALAHLPVDDLVPGLTRAPARPTPPPSAIPAGGAGCRILGDSDAGRARPVGLSVAAGRHHTQIIGSNGTGKTTCLLGCALQDAHAGRGLVFIEPKGESTLLLSRLPAEAVGKVVVFDPDDNAPPPSLNVLEGADANLTADTIVGIFRRIYADFWGPRTDDVLRSACLTLAGRPGATLAHVSRLLSDDAYRRRLTASISNPELAGFWSWYDDLSDGSRAQVSGPVMNKLRAVLLRGFARDILAAGPSTLNLPKLLDQGGIVIARLPKGVLGEDTARLLGSLILARTWQAVLARARTPEHHRPDIAIYLDECQNFLTLPGGLGDMLAEARAYRAGLVLAHQNLTQLPRDLRDTVSANARNKIIFAVSPEDATALHRHVHPHLAAHDLAHLDAFQAAARLMTGHALAPAFTLRTRPLPAPVPGRETAIRAASRATFANPARPRTRQPVPPPHDPRRP